MDPDTDPYTKFLENVKCTGVAKGYGNSSHRTQVLVSMYQWTSSRLYLARPPQDPEEPGLRGEGCLMSGSEWDLEVMPIPAEVGRQEGQDDLQVRQHLDPGR